MLSKFVLMGQRFGQARHEKCTFSIPFTFLIKIMNKRVLIKYMSHENICNHTCASVMIFKSENNSIAYFLQPELNITICLTN